MKFSFFFFLVSYLGLAQTFETYYNKARADYDNEFFKSRSFDDALNNCPDVTKYPELLVFKAVSLDYNSKSLLAVKYIKAALNYLEEKEYIYESHSLLGFAYSGTEDLDKSLYHYKTALKLAKELRNEGYVIENKFNILLTEYDVLEESGDTLGAEHQLKKILDFYSKLPKDFDAGTRLGYMSIIVEMSSDKALLNGLKKIKENINVQELPKAFQGEYYSNMVVLESQLGNYDTALKYCDSSYAISKEHLFVENRLKDFDSYKLLYEELNKPELALQYSDSILELEEDIKFKELESGIELIDENALFKKIEKQTSKKISNLNLVLIVLIITIGVVTLLLINSKKTRRKLNTLLDFQKNRYNKIWSSYQISSRQLKSLKQELTDLSNNASSNNTQIDSILRNLSIHFNSTSTEDVNYINTLNNEFTKEIKHKIPKLNDTECLVCFYLHLNLSHKKIAELLNKTEKSIDSYKYRINSKAKSELNKSINEVLKDLKINDLEYRVVVE